ncbi:MAG: hypothetical protein G5Z42_00700 [Caldisphaeraceae archaeon]|nr:hypothetical protein [Caldisphaeraceae archaeon]
MSAFHIKTYKDWLYVSDDEIPISHLDSLVISSHKPKGHNVSNTPLKIAPSSKKGIEGLQLLILLGNDVLIFNNSNI